LEEQPGRLNVLILARNFYEIEDFVVHRQGRPYFFTALIVRVFQVMGKWILPLYGGV